MFTPTTWYVISKDLADLWGELEDETSIKQTETLVKGYDKGTKEWYKEQLKNIPNFTKSIVGLANNKINKINDESVEAIKKAIDLVDIETTKAIKTMTGLDSSTDDKEQFIASAAQKLVDFNKGQLGAFISSAVVKHNQMINNINIQAEHSERTNIKVKAGIFNKTQGLYDIIRKQTEIGIAQGQPVVYKNGRQMPFKAHMEMSIRTTIQNEATDRMERVTANLGIIFFLASEHADCADDHAEAQGKIYVHQNWQSMVKNDELREKVRAFIEQKDIKTIQWVKGAPTYFVTRPNCRHFFVPITIEQAMGNIEALKSRLRTKKGTYKAENYEDLKAQRYNERAIRYYKNRLVNNQIHYENTSDPKLRAEIAKQIDQDMELVRGWQKAQRKLIAKNPNLKRQYRREDANKMAQDLGVKLQLKKEEKNKSYIPNEPKEGI